MAGAQRGSAACTAGWLAGSALLLAQPRCWQAKPLSALARGGDKGTQLEPKGTCRSGWPKFNDVTDIAINHSHQRPSLLGKVATPQGAARGRKK